MSLSKANKYGNHVLVVDDEPAIAWSLREHLTEEGFRVEVAATGEQAWECCHVNLPDVILLDVSLPGINGLELLERLNASDLHAPSVIIMTAFGTLETAVRAVEQGAADYLVKPFDLEQITRIVREMIDRRETAKLAVPPSPIREGGLIGRSQQMQEVFKQIALVAGTKASVLITGETGSGKELVAEAIHRYSSRRNEKFLAIHLAALNPDLIDSELFGHVRGAFTGAESNRPGLLEIADGGTVFLDEIGDVPLAIQVKLLRALERREYTPVGDPRPRRADFRLIAATHRSLPQLVIQGKFRADLWYRLNTFRIAIPPLRERLEDLPLLVEFLLGELTANRLVPQIASDFSEELLRRSWPGNVRELRQALESALILAQGRELRAEHLPPIPTDFPLLADIGADIEGMLTTWLQSRWNEPHEGEQKDERDGIYMEFLKAFETPFLQNVLERCGGNCARAAQILGMHRTTLREKLRRS